MLGWWTHRRVLKRGAPGRATIVGLSPPGEARSYNARMILQVRVPGSVPYEVEDEWWVRAGDGVVHGRNLPVRVDPDDPEKVAIDWKTARAELDAQTDARRAALAAEGPVGGNPSVVVTVPAGSGGAEGISAEALAKLERLDALRRSGGITAEEFEEQKRRLLH